MASLRTLSLACALVGVSVVTTQARTRHVDQSIPPFDRHAVHSEIGLRMFIREIEVRRPKVSGFKQMRKKRENRVRGARSVQERPGTLAAYRSEIAKATIDETAAPPTSRALGNTQGLKSTFVEKLASLRAAMPAGLSFRVGSGFRTYAQQAALHAQKPRLAARPGRSNHERGLAGDLKFSSRESARWIHRNSRKYGLRFPMSYEPWHIEPVGATRYASKRVHHRRYATAM